MYTKLALRVLLVVMLLVASVGPVAHAQPPEPPTPEQIEESIVKGLTWLAAQQNPDGSWGPADCNTVAYTGLVLLKLETRALELGLDPMGAEYEYSEHVVKGLDYLVANSHEVPISPQPAGNPDSNGNGIGIAFYGICGSTYHVIYMSSLAMMAIATSGHPELYGDLLQDAVDFMAWAQEDVGCEPHRGGWRYQPDQCSSDNSNSGYVTLALGYASAAPPFGFGLTIPDWVKSELSIWIDVIQDDVNGDANDGGSWYDPGNPWVNILKTGNLIYEMGLVGDTVETQRVKDAIDYIERHWGDPGGGAYDPGWENSRQSMFTMMKGLESLNIQYLDLDGDGVAETEWFPIVAAHLIATQNADGSWPPDYWAGPIATTPWALLTLERAVPSFDIPVAVDIHPTSCPNPINTGSGGMTPVAILGTEDFDVTQIDPASILLEGVSPVRWAWEDVATPYDPFTGKETMYDCTTAGPDGFVDLTLKFKTQELVAAGVFDGVPDGSVLVLHLTGNLMEEYGGTPIVGEDVVKVLAKTNMSAAAEEELFLPLLSQ